MVVDQKKILEELKSALIILAGPGQKSLSKLPPGSLKPDEAALDYENFLSVALGNFKSHFTNDQRDLLLIVDSKLNDLSYPENKNKWTETAFISSPEWDDIRVTARAALEKLKWK